MSEKYTIKPLELVEEEENHWVLYRGGIRMSIWTYKFTDDYFWEFDALMVDDEDGICRIGATQSYEESVEELKNVYIEFLEKWFLNEVK